MCDILEENKIELGKNAMVYVGRDTRYILHNQKS